ncbi:MAG: hypothetical protein B1H07_00070 [Campylobacteraceae bacterium 4484_166]|nr:MAG: hypothetical protein B1H07_00070 [Campylobacteraceae bacterium 4484_166]
MIKLNDSSKVIGLILIAFVFSVSIRMIWVYNHQDEASYKFNDSFMITTNDGYYFAEGARDILKGVDTNEAIANHSAVTDALSQLTAFVAKILPFAFEDLIFYFPIFFSSLIVIPMVLIGQNLGRVSVGFISALLASITWSYYNRTMAGYYDTDMLNIVFPIFLLWSLIGAVKTNHDRYIFLVAMEVILYRWWYPQSYALEFAFIALLVVFAIFNHFKKENNIYIWVIITFMLLSSLQIDGYIRFVFVILLFLFLSFKKDIFYKYIYYILGFAVLLFVATGGLSPILRLLDSYVFDSSVKVSDTTILQLHFYTVMQTISEASKIPFETFANRISGHSVTFFIALVGYLWLSYKHRVMLLALPLVGLGFLAIFGGLRFTIYAIPPLALGLAYLIVQAGEKIEIRLAKYATIFILTTAALAPNIYHVINYKVSTVFSAQEVQILDKLKTIAPKDSYVVGWWDYGYPLRYYADSLTLIDGGKHSGSANFPVSFALTQPQNLSAKMMRLDVEYTQKRVLKHLDILDGKIDKNETDSPRFKRSNIANMTLDYGFDDTNDFLSSLQGDIKLPTKTKDIYLYLPYRMVGIYPVIKRFSNLDLMTGTKAKDGFYFYPQTSQESERYVTFNKYVALDKQKGVLIFGDKQYKIKQYITISYDNNLKTQKKIIPINSSGDLSVIYMQSSKRFIFVDDSVLDSVYFQMFIFDNFDKNLFDKVIDTPYAKVYKLKI